MWQKPLEDSRVPKKRLERKLAPSKKGHIHCTCRGAKKGCRLDYNLVPRTFFEQGLVHNFRLGNEINTSDHIPQTFELDCLLFTPELQSFEKLVEIIEDEAYLNACTKLEKRIEGSRLLSGTTSP
jgi:hypothetical protein